jgi:hypothetical protein
MRRRKSLEEYRINSINKITKMGIAQHLTENGVLYGTMNRNIVAYKNDQVKVIGKFPPAYPRDLFSFSRILSRAARSDKSNIYVNSAGKILGIRGGVVYSISDEFNFISLFNIQGDCVLHRGICQDIEGWSCFGEYFTNPQRNEVRIHRVSPDQNSWEIAYKFKAGKIRHVHSIARDPFDEKSLWITVGDYKNECYILKTNDRFKTVKYFGNGDQIWRAVTLFFTESHVCWITDSHLEQNYACRMDRKTGEIEKGQKFDCSSWYGCTTKEGIHVAFTTVEKGPGIKRDESSIYISEDAYNWSEVLTYKKDRFRPYSIFKNGVISCPSGNLDLKNFYISGEGLVELDGVTLGLDISKRVQL